LRIGRKVRGETATPMTYEVEFKPKATRDLESLPHDAVARIISKIEFMRAELAGDVKRLTSFTPEYRLRAGDYRVLFEIEGAKIIVYRVRHRREVYRQ